MILPDKDKCIGCAACSNVCPNHFTTREDGLVRTIRWSKCTEECDLCVEFCPEKALSLVPECDETEIVHEFVRCKTCGRGFATERMMDRIASTVPPHLLIDSSGLNWLEICPDCRRAVERERAARPVMIARQR